MRKYSSGRLYRLSYILLFSAVILVIAAAIIIFKIDHELERIIEPSVTQKASQIITDKVADTLKSSELCGEYLSVTRDSEGNILSLDTDSSKINKLASQLELSIGSALEQSEGISASIPVGELTGIGLIGGRGFDINVDFHSIGNVRTRIDSELESVSVNQTRHCIKLYITADICAVLPTKSINITYEQEYLINETVIIGQIPQVYLEK